MANIPIKYRAVSTILLAIGTGFLAYSSELIKAYPEAGIAIGMAVIAVREVVKEYGTESGKEEKELAVPAELEGA